MHRKIVIAGPASLALIVVVSRNAIVVVDRTSLTRPGFRRLRSQQPNSARMARRRRRTTLAPGQRECKCNARWRSVAAPAVATCSPLRFHRRRRLARGGIQLLALRSGCIGYIVGPERFYCGCRVLWKRT